MGQLFLGLILMMANAETSKPCLVTSDIEEFKAQGDKLQRACGPGIESVSIIGDHKRLVYKIKYSADWEGREIAHTVAHFEASRSARESCSILRKLYPTEVCAYRITDGKDHPVCATEIAADESGTTVCVSRVGE